MVDSGSSDGTLLIAREKGARVAIHDWKGFGPQKNYALSLAQGDWVLSIDADERVTPELAQAIQRGDRRTARPTVSKCRAVHLLRPR